MPVRDLTGSAITKKLRLHGWTWKFSAVVLSLSGGIASWLGGSALTAVSWFSDPVWHGLSLHQLGTVLLVVTVPLLILGAHCLDLMDKQDEEAKNGRVQQKGSSKLGKGKK